MKMYTLVEGDYQAIDLPNYLDFNCIFFFSFCTWYFYSFNDQTINLHLYSTIWKGVSQTL